jgi:hypothetical protein
LAGGNALTCDGDAFELITLRLLPITEIPHSRSPKFPSGLSGAEGLM